MKTYILSLYNSDSNLDLDSLPVLHTEILILHWHLILNLW